MKINVDRLSTGQRSNLREALLAYENRDPISGKTPPVLYIELTRNCISRCEFCRGPKWQNSPVNTMKPELFDLLLRDYIPYATLVDLRGWGESLILPNFADYVRRVVALGPKMRLTTTLGCGAQEALEAIIEHDVFVSVSLDSVDKKRYEKIRVGINFDTVVKNLEFLTRGFLRKYGDIGDHIRIGISPLQGGNIRDVGDILEFAHRLNIKRVHITPLEGDSRLNSDLLDYHKYKTTAALKKALEYAVRFGMDLQLGKPLFADFRFDDNVFDVCCHPWLYAQIDYRGEMLFCDHLLHMDSPSDKIFKFGNICNENNGALWNGQNAQQVRRLHAQQYYCEMNYRCSSCYKTGRYGDHEHEIDARFLKWRAGNDFLKRAIPLVEKKNSINLVSDAIAGGFFTAENFLRPLYRRLKGSIKNRKIWAAASAKK